MHMGKSQEGERPKPTDVSMAPIKEFESAFARGMLEKYGWKEGKGLGRNEDGIVKAIRPKLKFDKTGIGHDPAKEFTSRWWEQAYNTTAEKLIVKSSEEDSTVKIQNPQSDVNVKKRTPPISTYNTMEYSSFTKGAVLTSTGETINEKESSDSDSEEDTMLNRVCQISDEDLLKICGGRTAHKGARHGLKLTGKLSRIEQQEKEIAAMVDDPDFMSELPIMMKKWTKQIEEGVQWLEAHTRRKTKEQKSLTGSPKIYSKPEGSSQDTPVKKSKKRKGKKAELDCITPTNDLYQKSKSKKEKKRDVTELEKKKKPKEESNEYQEHSEEDKSPKVKKAKHSGEKDEFKTHKKAKKLSMQSSLSPRRKKVKGTDLEETGVKKKKKTSSLIGKDKFVIQLGGAGDAETITLREIRKKKHCLGDITEIPATPDRLKGFPEPGSKRKKAKKES